MGSVVRHSVALALVAVFLSAGVAFAGHGGNGITRTFFTAFGNCAGERIVKGGPDGFVKDVEVCVQPAHFFDLEPGKYSVWDPAIGGWWSDYEIVKVDPADPICLQPISMDREQCIRLAVSGTVTVTKGPHKTYLWFINANY
jgi:hypothetical protein